MVRINLNFCRNLPKEKIKDIYGKYICSGFSVVCSETLSKSEVFSIGDDSGDYGGWISGKKIIEYFEKTKFLSFGDKEQINKILALEALCVGYSLQNLKKKDNKSIIYSFRLA